jgi:hypothetical protein
MRKCVVFEVQTEFLNILFYMNFGFKGLILSLRGLFIFCTIQQHGVNLKISSRRTKKTSVKCYQSFYYVRHDE